MILILVCLVFSSCTLPESASKNHPQVSETSSVWIDAPLQNAIIPLLPNELIFHATSLSGIDGFEVQVNGAVLETVGAMPSSSGNAENKTLFLGKYLWNPPVPGTYLVRILAISQGKSSSEDQVRVTVSGGETETVTPVPTEEQVECMFTALVNLFCRLGPGREYKDIDSLIPGQSAPIIGQSPDGLYWYILGPYYGQACTVPKDSQYGEASGDCESKPDLTPIATPVTPATTGQPTGCMVFQPGLGNVCTTPCPAGAIPGDACSP